MRDHDTICAPATPRGDGAVGMLRLSGPRSLELCLAATGKEAAALPPRRMVTVTVRDPDSGAALDSALACHYAAPASYTGEQAVELFGHGGQLNMDRLLQLFLGLGARLAEPGEFTRRAFINGRLDLEQAEAVAAVIGARSGRALDNAQALLGGALGRRVRRVRDELVELAARLEAAVDFADDLQGELSAADLEGRHARAAEQLDALARSHDQAAALDELTVALVGPANAGKSSLFNRLLQRDRALVDPTPGTTRDYLEAEVSWGGLRITLVDTAGSRAEGEPEQPLERRGRQLAGPLLDRCALLIRVVDLDTDLPADLPDGPAPCLVAANKVDLAPAGRLEALRRSAGEGRPVMATSALTGQGIGQLRQAVTSRLESLLPDGESLVVTGRRQHQCLLDARRALDEGRRALDGGLPPELVVEHTNLALAYLAQITGENVDEAVLNAIFSAFCLGK